MAWSKIYIVHLLRSMESQVNVSEVGKSQGLVLAPLVGLYCQITKN